MSAELDVLDTPRAAGLVARGGLLRIVGFAFGLGLSLLGVVVVTRHLGVVDYGRYQSVVALVAVVAAVGDGGLGTLALREHARLGGAAREEVLRALLGLRLALSACSILLAAALAVVLGFDATMVVGTTLAAGAGVLSAAQTTLSVPLQTRLRLGTVTALELARQTLTTGAFVGLAAAGAGLLPFLAVPIPVLAAVLAATVVLARAVRPTFAARDWAPLLRTAVTFGAATATGVIYLYTSLLVCQVVATPEETGWFSASFRIVVVVAAVPALLGTSAFPLLSRAASDRPRLARTVDGLLEGAAALGAAAVVVVVLGAPDIVRVVAGSGFAPAADALRIQGAALGLTFVISILGFTLLATHRHRAVLLCNAAALGTSAVAVAALAAADGARGAALGALIGEVVLCCGYGVAARDLGLRPRRLPRLAAALALALGAGAAVSPPVVAVALGLAVLVVAARLLGGVPARVPLSLLDRERPGGR